MSRPSIHVTKRWLPKEDAILVACWPDPDIDFVAIAKLIPGRRTVGAIRHRGCKIGLGRKARHKKVQKPGELLTAWPDDMPDFEDHPDAAAPGPRAKAVRLGSRFKSFSQNAETSHTGSSLDGAAIHPTGRRV